MDITESDDPGPAVHGATRHPDDRDRPESRDQKQKRTFSATKIKRHSDPVRYPEWMIVRNATGLDGPAISDLMVRAAPHFDTKCYPDQLLPPGMTVLVAMENGRVVGWLEGVLDWDYTEPGAPTPPPHGYILAVVVDPESRRRGIGRALLDLFVAEAREADVRWVYLIPEGGEGTAGRLAFFHAAGFTELPPTDDPLPPMGRWTDVEAMAHH